MPKPIPCPTCVTAGLRKTGHLPGVQCPATPRKSVPKDSLIQPAPEKISIELEGDRYLQNVMQQLDDNSPMDKDFENRMMTWAEERDWLAVDPPVFTVLDGQKSVRFPNVVVEGESVVSIGIQEEYAVWLDLSENPVGVQIRELTEAGKSREEAVKEAVIDKLSRDYPSDLGFAHRFDIDWENETVDVSFTSEAEMAFISGEELDEFLQSTRVDFPGNESDTPAGCKFEKSSTWDWE